MCLFIMGVLCTSLVNAQEYKVIKFYHHDSYLTYHEEKQGELTVDSKYNNSNELSQYFILKRAQDGLVFIASAKDPDKLLMRDGSLAKMAQYEESEHENFLWSIDYAGFPKCVITAADHTRKALYLDGYDLKFGRIPALNSNDDSDNFRFQIQWSEAPIF